MGMRLKLVEFLTIISGAKSEINLAISFWFRIKSMVCFFLAVTS